MKHIEDQQEPDTSVGVLIREEWRGSIHLWVTKYRSQGQIVIQAISQQPLRIPSNPAQSARLSACTQLTYLFMRM